MLQVFLIKLNSLNCSFTKKEILACEEKLKTSKALGVDMIKNEVLKLCLDDKSFMESLQLLVNKIFNDGTYPTTWKTELIRPIHKKEETYLKKATRVLVLPHVWNFLTIYYQ